MHRIVHVRSILTCHLVGTYFVTFGSLILILTGIFLINMAPNGIEMGWEMVPDAIRFILAKYEPLARHGNLFYRFFRFFGKSWVGDHSETP